MHDHVQSDWVADGQCSIRHWVPDVRIVPRVPLDHFRHSGDRGVGGAGGPQRGSPRPHPLYGPFRPLHENTTHPLADGE